MAKEQFFYPESPGLLKLLDEAAHRGGVSRGKAFEDFLHMAVCFFGRPRMEEEYLEVVKQYTEGKPGKRGCDSMAQLFTQMIAATEDSPDEMKDILGDLFEGSITYGERGQFFTPMNLCRVMVRLQTADLLADDGQPAKRIYDPASGSGRMLMAAAEVNRHWTFYGRDIDLRCVRMTAINMAMRNLYGYALWGNSLKNEIRLIYRTGFNGLSFLRYGRPDELASLAEAEDAAAQEARQQTTTDVSEHSAEADSRDEGQPSRQLRLF